MDDHLVTDAVFGDRKLPVCLDSGAETTDLYPAFGNAFNSLVRKSGIKSTTEGIGVGGAENFESITLPDQQIGLGGLNTMLHPARMLLKQVGPARCAANAGFDLLKQAEWFKIDFES